MRSLKTLRAGDFIDLDNWFREIVSEDYTNADKFYLILLEDGDTDVEQVMKKFIEEMTEIKETFVWLFNPPPMPTSSDVKERTIGDDYRQEFAEDYGSYTELIYLICTTFSMNPEQVYQMKAIDFLYWGEYLSRKRTVENIK